MPSAAWIVVADSSRCRIFSSDKPAGPLAEIEALAHPEGRLHERELASDRPGRAFDSKGEGRHAMSSEVGAKKHEAIVFATRIAERLESGRSAGDFERLVLVAPPSFLGLLRERLKRPLRARVAREVGKNMTLLKARALRAQLPKRLY